MKQYRITMPDDRGVKYESFKYPGGEVQVRLIGDLTEISQAQKICVLARVQSDALMGLACLTDALKSQANPEAFFQLYLPYLSYSRADRAFVSGDCFGLKAFVNQLNGLGYNRIYTLDVHSQVAVSLGIKNYQVNLLINKALDDIHRPEDRVTMILPDAGAEKRYLGLGTNADFTIQAEKVRDPKTGVLSGFIAPLLPTNIGLIVDDICDGGGTFIGLAKEIKRKQPDVKLYLYVTHGIFSKGFDDLNQYFEKIYTSDSLWEGDGVDGPVTVVGGANGL